MDGTGSSQEAVRLKTRLLSRIGMDLRKKQLGSWLRSREGHRAKNSTWVVA